MADFFTELKRRQSTTLPLLAAAALLLALFAYYDIVCYRDFLLRGDDPAFIGATLSSPIDWFTRGYADYFDVYPEWGTRIGTDFIRPVTNLVAYANHAVFGENYALHFALFFLVQFASLAIILRLLRETSVPPAAAAGMGLLYLFNPAFLNAGLTGLAFHFDVLAALMELAALLALWRGRNIVALILLTLAVFTKETAVFAPLAAALTVLVWSGNRRSALLMLSPLVPWIAARFFVSGDVLGRQLDIPAGSVAAGVLVWPTGMTPYDIVIGFPSMLTFSRRDMLWTAWIAVNAAMWVFMFYAVYIASRRALASSPQGGKADQLAAAFPIWMLGALAVCVITAPLTRYGSGYYAFLYLFLGNFLFSPAARVPRWLSASVVLVFSAATAFQLERSLEFSSTWQSFVSRERALYDALRALPQDGGTVYVVSAPPAYVSAPKYLTRAWSLNLNVVIVNHALRCARSDDSARTEFAEATPGLLDVRIPDCAEFGFTRVSPDLYRRGIGGTLLRERIGTYQFPEGHASADGSNFTLGHELKFQIDPTQHPIILTYNWTTGAYSPLPRR